MAPMSVKAVGVVAAGDGVSGRTFWLGPAGRGPKEPDYGEDVTTHVAIGEIGEITHNSLPSAL